MMNIAKDCENCQNWNKRFDFCRLFMDFAIKIRNPSEQADILCHNWISKDKVTK